MVVQKLNHQVSAVTPFTTFRKEIYNIMIIKDSTTLHTFHYISL